LLFSASTSVVAPDGLTVEIAEQPLQWKSGAANPANPVDRPFGFQAVKKW
jgi:hypothetical protein